MQSESISNPFFSSTGSANFNSQHVGATGRLPMVDGRLVPATSSQMSPPLPSYQGTRTDMQHLLAETIGCRQGTPSKILDCELHATKIPPLRFNVAKHGGLLRTHTMHTFAAVSTVNSDWKNRTFRKRADSWNFAASLLCGLQHGMQHP